MASIRCSIRRVFSAGVDSAVKATRGIGLANVLVSPRLRSPMWASNLGSVKANARLAAFRAHRCDTATCALMRHMSTGASERGATTHGSVLDPDGSDQGADPYLPHRINMEKAKEYIAENVKKGMTHEQVNEIVDKAIELHIPPVPSLEVLAVCESVYIDLIFLSMVNGLISAKYNSTCQQELYRQEEETVQKAKEARLQKDLQRSKEEVLNIST
jgi:hypothetical protein